MSKTEKLIRNLMVFFMVYFPLRYKIEIAINYILYVFFFISIGLIYKSIKAKNKTIRIEEKIRKEFINEIDEFFKVLQIFFISIGAPIFLTSLFLIIGSSFIPTYIKYLFIIIYGIIYFISANKTKTYLLNKKIIKHELNLSKI